MVKKLIFGTMAAGIVFCCGFFVGKYVEQQKCPARTEHCLECERKQDEARERSERDRELNEETRRLTDEAKRISERTDAMLEETQRLLGMFDEPDASIGDRDGGV